MKEKGGGGEAAGLQQADWNREGDQSWVTEGEEEKEDVLLVNFPIKNRKDTT